MKAEIEQFKKENGNVSYTIKELLFAVHKKIDRLDKKLDTKINSKTFWIIITASFGFSIFLLAEILKMKGGN